MRNDVNEYLHNEQHIKPIVVIGEGGGGDKAGGDFPCHDKSVQTHTKVERTA